MRKERNTSSLQFKSFGLALQALVVLARTGGICPSCDIAQCLHSEPTLLRRILVKLVRGRILETREGRDGGYFLRRPADELTLAEVYRALEVGETQTRAVLGTTCSNAFGLQMQDRLAGVMGAIDSSVLERLNEYTLADLAVESDS